MHRTHPSSRTPRRLVAALTLLAVTATAGLAACDDDPAAAPTEDEWRAEAAGICDEVGGRLEAAFAELGDDPDEAAVQRLYDTVLPEVRAMVEDLGELEAPASIETEVERFVAAGRDGLAEAEASDPGQVRTDDQDPFAELSRRADRLGVASCTE